MKRIAAVTVAVVLGALVGGLIFIYSGIYNIAARDAHWPITVWAFETIRDRSIRARAADIAVPTSLNEQARIVGGADHFAAHCAVCHGAPGVAKGELATGMSPPPPNLDRAAQRFAPAELFWIVKNGIRMTGMPSWADHGDDELWNVVAFLAKLPGMPTEEYKRLVAAARAQPGHRHGMEGMGMEDSGHNDHSHGAAGGHDHGEAGNAPANRPLHEH